MSAQKTVSSIVIIDFGQILDHNLEDRNLNWIHKRRENMLRVLRKHIMRKIKMSEMAMLEGRFFKPVENGLKTL